MDMATSNHEEYMKALVEKEPRIAESVGLGNGGVVPVTHGRGKARSEDADGACILLVASPSSDFGRIATKVLKWEKGEGKGEGKAVLVRSRKVALTKEQANTLFGGVGDASLKIKLVKDCGGGGGGKKGCGGVVGEILAMEFNVLGGGGEGGEGGEGAVKKILEEEDLTWIGEGEMAVEQSKNLFSVWKENQ